MRTVTIEVEHLTSGQPRAYADHKYTSNIVITGKKYSERDVKDLAKVVVRRWTKDIGEVGNMGESFLKECRLVDSGRTEDNRIWEKWFVHVMECFCG